MKKILFTTLALLFAVSATASPVHQLRAWKVALAAFQMHSMEMSAKDNAKVNVWKNPKEARECGIPQ